jgi:Holliday junction resolvasome RuvABC ATP-dependent DNA helicase subunit
VLAIPAPATTAPDNANALKLLEIHTAGFGTIAVAAGEEAKTLEEVHEPFLIEEGYRSAHRKAAC